MKLSSPIFVLCGLILIPAISSAQSPRSPVRNAYGTVFDKDPSKSDAAIRYNYTKGQSAGASSFIGQGAGGKPAEVVVEYVNGRPVISTKSDSVTGIDWQDMNKFSKDGAKDYPEEKLINELNKPMPERHPFGDRMKDISRELQGSNRD